MANDDKNPLATFADHGVHLKESGSTGQAWGECPFCARAKFAYSVEKQQWQCFVCGEKGNLYTFLKRVWEESEKGPHTDTIQLRKFAESRSLLSQETLSAWGFRKQFITDEWVVPGYNHEGSLVQLYRFAPIKASGKPVLQCTTGLGHGLFGRHLFDKAKPEVWLVEGVWNAMVLWELFSQVTIDAEGTLSRTANKDASILGSVNILATAGANVFGEKWVKLVEEKNVTLVYDNDWPLTNPRTGAPVEGAGWAGMKRASGVMARASEKPESIQILQWGSGLSTQDHDPGYKSGYDVRDYFNEAPAREGVRGRIKLLPPFLEKIVPIPDDWVLGRGKDAIKKGGVELKPVECKDLGMCLVEWRKAMKWTEGLDRFLKVCLAAALSTRQGGQEQLWVRGVSPPSTGKTTVAEAIAVAGDAYAEVVSQFTGLYSGMMSDAEASEDLSLIAKVQNKVFIIKEGNTLTESPNVETLMSQLRDLFDRKTRSSFKNRASRKYSTNCVNIICGTETMRREMDKAELGGRYLDCRIMTHIDLDVEKDVVRMKVRQAAREVKHSASDEGCNHYSPELTRAYQVTGGYVRHLMDNSADIMRDVEDSDKSLDFCGDCGLLVAYLRSRPSETHDEEQEREFAARLPAQFVRLGMCLAAVVGTNNLDSDEVLGVVRQTALDTCWGRTAQIAKLLYDEGVQGAEQATLSYWLSMSAHKVRELLNFLVQIRVAERFDQEVEGPRGPITRLRWRLTRELARLWKAVVESPLTKKADPTLTTSSPGEVRRGRGTNRPEATRSRRPTRRPSG